MRKNYYARNDRGQKIFCKYSTAPTGVLFVDYFLPKYKFSIYWPVNHPLIRVHNVTDTLDERKVIVTFMIHPNAWMGADFNHPTYKDTKSICNEVFTNYINIY